MALVNNVAVEEVQNTLGIIHFHHHFKGKATVAIWRSRALEKSLSGEFAFQCKFDRKDEVPKIQPRIVRRVLPRVCNSRLR